MLGRGHQTARRGVEPDKEWDGKGAPKGEGWGGDEQNKEWVGKRALYSRGWGQGKGLGKGTLKLRGGEGE